MAAPNPPSPAAPEPRREKFKQTSKLPEEPKSDVAIKTASGLTLRERVKKLHGPQGVSLIFTYTRLDDDGKVMRGPDGDALVTDPHEVVVTAEDAIRVGEQGVADALKAGREVAVARATDHFNGLDALPKILSDLLTSRV